MDQAKNWDKTAFVKGMGSRRVKKKINMQY